MAEEDDVSLLISERWTQKKYIDPELEMSGWLKNYIKEEVNSVESDFLIKDRTFFYSCDWEYCLTASFFTSISQQDHRQPAASVSVPETLWASE